ncbi:hypothetical protein MTO96_052082 [Rhipicephalus appendiculatus]
MICEQLRSDEYFFRILGAKAKNAVKNTTEKVKVSVKGAYKDAKDNIEKAVKEAREKLKQKTVEIMQKIIRKITGEYALQKGERIPSIFKLIVDFLKIEAGKLKKQGEAMQKLKNCRK